MTECIEWVGASTPPGYGKFTEDNRGHYIHRRSFEAFYGPIPPGKWVLHTCDNPPCYNPMHLFLGTALDNARDRAAKGRNGNRVRLICKRGHDMTGENLRVTPNGSRQCRTCGRESKRRRRAAGKTD